MIELLKLCLRITLNGIITFLDAVSPPMPVPQPALKSAAVPEPVSEPVKPEPKIDTKLVHVGTYPIASHAEMYLVAPKPEPSIDTIVIQLPAAPNDALVAIAEVLTCTPGRAQIVDALLDEAWQQGITTYSALIGYVKDKSGQGCSKKTVSAWKKSRRLDEAEEQIAA